MVNTVSTVSFKRMRTAKAILIFSKKSTAQAAVRIISQTVRRDSTWHDGKGIAIEKYGSSVTPDLVFPWAKVENAA